MDGDLLLRWMSETGSGSVRDLRLRLTWASQTTGYWPRREDTGRWLRDAVALGHVEVDWDGGDWAVAPPAAAVLPASGGTAVLAGSRRVGLVSRLEELLSVQVVESPETAAARLAPPPAVFVQADSFAQLRAALEDVGVRSAGCSARGIARALPQIELGETAAPPSRTDVVKQVGTRRQKVVGSEPKDDGPHSIKVQGRDSYRYWQDGVWYRTDYATGILLYRASRGASVMRFKSRRTTPQGEVGTVFVDREVPLPPLQARALVLCSGLPPELSVRSDSWIYRNVPEDIARLVAKSIRQELPVNG